MTNVLAGYTTIRTRLQAAVWPGVGGEAVFGSVVITAGTENEWAERVLRFPAAVLRPMDGQADPSWGEEPSLIHETIAVRLYVAVPGDAMGENATIGANKSAGAVSSKGRGLLEVEQRLLAEIEFINAHEGLLVQERARSRMAGYIDEQEGYVAFRDYLFEMVVTST